MNLYTCMRTTLQVYSERQKSVLPVPSLTTAATPSCLKTLSGQTKSVLATPNECSSSSIGSTYPVVVAVVVVVVVVVAAAAAEQRDCGYELQTFVEIHVALQAT